MTDRDAIVTKVWHSIPESTREFLMLAYDHPRGVVLIDERFNDARTSLYFEDAGNNIFFITSIGRDIAINVSEFKLRNGRLP